MTSPMLGARGRRRLWPGLALCSLVVALLLKTLLPAMQASIPTPQSTTDQCRLHYSHFHLFFTLPPLFVLFLLARPFLTALDWHKLYVLPMIAFIWTTPWDNELVRMGAWWYPASCVLTRIGYVPVEEYAFFVIQSLATTLLTILLTRWSTPRTGKQASAAKMLPIISATVVMTGLYNLLVHEDGQTSRYYLSMILWWAAIPLTLLLWGTCQSWAAIIQDGQSRYYLLSIVLSTAYLCCADVFALRRGTWHISERRSLQVFAVQDLPIEEALFFLATNSILVCACFAFDRVVWKVRGEEDNKEEDERSSHEAFAPLSPTHFHLSSLKTIKTIWSAFTRLDAEPSNKSNTEAVLLEHRQRRSFGILASASKTFSTAAALLPWDLRVDLSSVYAFARAMDDFIDRPKEEAVAEDRIALLRALVAEMYASGCEDRTASAEHFAHSKEGEGKYLADLRVTALAARQLRGIIPERLWQDLIDGLSTDCAQHGPNFVNFTAQADYAQSVAGAIGEMCVRIILARSGYLVAQDYIVSRDITREDLLASKSHASCHEPLDPKHLRSSQCTPTSLEVGKIEQMLRDARRMGVCLQLVNIARDVVEDSTQLHRCYLVTGREDRAGIRQALCDGHLDFSSHSSAVLDEEKEVQALMGHTPALSRDVIFAEKLHLLNLADAIYASSIDSIELLPSPAARTGLRVACAVYANIGSVIRRKGAQDCLEKSRASTWERIYVAIRAAYFP